MIKWRDRWGQKATPAAAAPVAAPTVPVPSVTAEAKAALARPTRERQQEVMYGKRK